MAGSAEPNLALRFLVCLQRHPGHQEGAVNLPAGFLLPVYPFTEAGLMCLGFADLCVSFLQSVHLLHYLL